MASWILALRLDSLKALLSLVGYTLLDRNINSNSSEIHKNVVLITIESYSAEFMEMYGNEQKITQIMISGEESEFGLVEELLTKRGLESKNAQMVVGRLKSMVGTLFLVVLGISVIAVFVSGLVLIQYMQLLMSRNAYEVRTLLRIGYPPQEIIRKFFFNFVKSKLSNICIV